MLFAIGINHRTAPLELRERLAFDPAGLLQALDSLRREAELDECLILSTCNRTELYGSAPATEDAALAWLTRTRQLDAAAGACLYRHVDGAAVQHLYSVACGLDSMILGEPQILGQLKDAYRMAQEAGSVGPRLHHLMQDAFAVAKRVRTETEVGASAMSAASATVALARQIFAGFTSHTGLLVGAGEMIELAARRLADQGLGHMIIANRSLERGHALAAEYGGYAIGLDEIDVHLADADLVISSTASPTHVISRGAVRAALRARRRKPMFLMDLAVPRDIDPRVAEFEDAYLYTVDDLREVVEAGRKQREVAATRARELIKAEAERFDRSLATLSAVPLIRELREELGRERDAALEQARRLLAGGRSPEDVLELLANTLTNKYLHQPSIRLRQAGEDADAQMLAAARKLFGIDSD